jgi:hypothetical protein
MQGKIVFSCGLKKDDIMNACFNGKIIKDKFVTSVKHNAV